MPRFIIPPKYTYAQMSGSLRMPFVPSGTFSGWYVNGMVPWLAGNPAKAIFCPAPALPTKGADTNNRSHSKITVTSVRWKFSIQLNMDLVNKGSCLSSKWLTNITNAYTGNADAVFPYALDGYYEGDTWTPYKRPIQWPPNPGQFLKFRYFMVEFDEDLAITERTLFSWFYSTFCQYRELKDPENYPEKYPLPTETPSGNNTCPGPISVHSNVMRMTTPWTGKFKILADRMFILTANRPRLNIDITVPINRVYTFADDWQYHSLAENTLLSPHIYAFIMPPLSFEQDFGPYDSYAYQKAMGDYSVPVLPPQSEDMDFVSVESWMKLHFVDI